MQSLVTPLLIGSASNTVNISLRSHDLNEPNVGFLKSSKQVIIALLGSITIGLNIMVLFASATTLTVVNGALATIFITYSIRNEYVLANILSLRSLINKCRENTQQLMNENDKLLDKSNKLVTHKDALKEKEDGLTDILTGQNYTIDLFLNVINDHKALDKEIKRVVDLLMYQNLLGFVIESDANRNETIDQKEIDILIFRIKAFEYFDINEVAMRKLIADNNSNIYAIASNLLKIIEHGKKEEVDKIVQYKIDEFVRSRTRQRIVHSRKIDDDGNHIKSTRELCAMVAIDFDVSSDDDSSTDTVKSEESLKSKIAPSHSTRYQTR